MNFLKSISVENFKGFYEPQILKFAIPDGLKSGSGLSLIVGPNNTGKTTIIESLLMRNGKKFKRSERHNDGSLPKIILETAAGERVEFTNLAGGSTLQLNGTYPQINFEVVPSRRYWSHLFSGESSFDSFISSSLNSNIKNPGESNLGSLLKNILKDPAQKEKFNSILKSLVPYFTDWTLDTNDADQDYIVYRTSRNEHESSLLGDGVISLFRIVAHLIHDRETTLIIDEPELSLHPSAQKRLAQVISKLSKDKQVIICTHSPYFLNWSDFVNGARVIRLNKHQDEKCTVSYLDNDNRYSTFISTSIDEFQKPQLLDVAAKEIVFSDRILFVEGQEDVGLIKKWFSENDKAINFEIFGYGVGGEQNMQLFLEIAKDLNIERVAVLYDGNARSFVEVNSLYKEPQFLIRQIPTDDIRDKRNRCSSECPYGKEREGIFDESGVIKQEYKEAFGRIMEEIESFFV